MDKSQAKGKADKSQAKGKADKSQAKGKADKSQAEGKADRRQATEVQRAVPIQASCREGGEGHEEGPSQSESVGRGEGVAPTVPKKTTRPGYGKAGIGTQLTVNYFKTSLSKRGDVNHYNVIIEPEVQSRRMCREIMQSLRETYGRSDFNDIYGAYDGDRALFTNGSLPFKTMKFPVFLDNRQGPLSRPCVKKKGTSESSAGRVEELLSQTTPSGMRKFLVTIDFVAKIRMDSIEEMMKRRLGMCDQELENRAIDALRVLDIVLREIGSRRGYLLVRDNFFHPNLGQLCDVGDGVEGWRGYHSSLKSTQMGLMLNLDTAMALVLKPLQVDEFLMEKFSVRNLSMLQRRDWARAKEFLENVRIETTHSGGCRRHRIYSFSDLPIRELKFMKRSKDGEREEEVSVSKYYLNTYSYKLKYPDFPALDVGNSRKPTFIPIELCKIVRGQRYTKALSSKQRMIVVAANKQGPPERQKICENALTVCNYNSEKLIAEFGLQFNNKLESVSGRVLPAPQLDFGKGKTEEIKEGRWDFRNKSMKKGVTINAWAVAVFDPRCSDGDQIASQLLESCSRRGMVMKTPAVVQYEPQNFLKHSAEERVEKMMNALRPYAPVFILAILAEKDSPIYVPFKRFCEIRIGIVSQCMVRPRQLNDQYLGNLALKINLKMGGLNSPLSANMLQCLGQSTIIFGMDVSHGLTGDANSPSIAAVVATKNWPQVFHYSTRVKLQPPRVEMISGLYEPKGGLIRDLLMSFYSTCAKGVNPKPSQIIVYRDGISDTMFAKCLEVEFVAFKKACADLEPNYNPGITFIVVKKRHNTRFFPQTRATLRNGNVLPGTVVDKDACHPHNFDFFLVSQAGLIGTSRPTHYTVLVNENKLGPDDIQLLTNKLCYTFGRCTSSISLAAPVQYAHIVAARYRKLMNNLDGGSSKSSWTSCPADASRNSLALPIINMKPEHSMFFC